MFRFAACGSAIVAAIVGCADRVPSPKRVVATENKTADISILFIGNSHTSYCSLPELVNRMVTHVSPGRTVVHNTLGVGHLEDAATEPVIQKTILSRKWTFVVLQAQKISTSGKYLYSTKDGIALAKAAKDNGSAVFYFSEWGRKGVADERERTEKIYTEMASAAGVGVIPVGRAWDAALAERPDLPLHAPDGNHETESGAFLTACVLAAALTGQPATSFANVADRQVNEADRLFLAIAASQVDGMKPNPK